MRGRRTTVEYRQGKSEITELKRKERERRTRTYLASAEERGELGVEGGEGCGRSWRGEEEESCGERPAELHAT